MTKRSPATHLESETTAGGMRYPLPWTVGLGLFWSVLRGKKRSFALDAHRGISLLNPALQVLGSDNIPNQGPCLVTANHYSRTGFQAWWITFAISANLPFDLHWVMTDAWRFEGRPLASQLEAISRSLFSRIAWVYSFTSMPSMPPRAHETQKRAQAVRDLLRHTRQHACPAIGLVPEGYDMQGGVLGNPPAGVGRLIAHLQPYTQRILPAALYESQGHLCLQFGEPYMLEIPSQSNVEYIDRFASQKVMFAIARLLPYHLRGEYI